MKEYMVTMMDDTQRRMEERQARKLERLKKRRRQLLIRLGIAGVLILFLFIGMFRMAVGSLTRVVVTLKPADIELMQDEQMPELAVAISLNKKKEKVIDKETGYTSLDLQQELQNGNYYTVSCDADLTLEGDYPITVTLDEELQKKAKKTWKKRVKFKAESGTLTVKNKVGTWDGEKFQKYDGSYVTKDFVRADGKTYYFDENGEKLKGFQTINGKKYEFSEEDGVMTTSAWRTIDGKKYYFSKTGDAQTGLQKKKKGTYFFDKEGVMQTGTIRIGLKTSTFGEDGIMTDEGEISVDPSQPMIAMTFDDGPGDRTEEILDMLQQYNQHATFFMQGKNVSGHKETVKKMVETGCEPASHTWNHPKLTSSSTKTITSQCSRTNEAIKKASGSDVALLRPPYGAVNEKVRNTVTQPLIMWSIDTLDWKTRNVKKTVDCVMNDAGDGDIVLMHDIHTESVDAMLELIPKLTEKGYQLVTVSELAAAKGTTMKNGTKYFDFKE